jgi:hypothetical protein
VLQEQAFSVFLAGLGGPRRAEVWKAFEAPSAEPVFPEKDRGINYAHNRASFRSGEIRILDSSSYLECTIHSARRIESCDFLVPYFGLTSVFCNDLMKKDRALLQGEIFFNLVDQLGNIDWLRERWTSLDVEASLCLRFRD